MKKQTIQDIGEFGLHRRIQEILGPPSQEVLVGIGDDAAVLAPQTSPLVITKDAMVEGIHFQREWTSASDLAYKAIASNISDLAAKGATPAYGLIAIGLPKDALVSWIEEFYQTMADLREVWGLEIIGGDTVRSPQIWASITAIGRQITATPVRIDSAREGDLILTTGTLGDAAAGLELVQKGSQESSNPDESFLIQRFLRPTPRLAEAMLLLKQVQPSAMTDISDGLARDLPKVCRASGVSAQVDVRRLPASDALKRFPDSCRYAWQGGEDYELLFTLPPEQAKFLLNNWPSTNCPLTPIGEITPASQSMRLQNWEGPPLEGFDHFG
ncbi:MAG: thiamine-phosphate kinase [Candidatus Omnitrophica bacterium]|nr:thiamine-phosphate kinase [Candidatus Omnitrophota bacterium]